MWNAATAKGLRPAAEFCLDRPLRRGGSVIMFNCWEHFEATLEVVAPTGSVRPCATRSKQLG